MCERPTEKGDMDYELVKSISLQTPGGVVVQFHDNGEPLLYDRLGDVWGLFANQIKCFDTNGKLLLEKADEIIGKVETIAVSVFEGDVEADRQHKILKEFLKIKGDRKPNVIVRCLGEVDKRFMELGCLVCRRSFRSSTGNFDYTKKPNIPEIGICLDALTQMTIKRTGEVKMCPNPMSEVLGNAVRQPLVEIWGGKLRQGYLELHISGKRSEISSCAKCEYWGLP